MMNTNLIKMQVGSIFVAARDRLNASDNPVLRRAATSGRAAVDNFKIDMLGKQGGISRTGHAIVRCAEKPVDERIKMRV